MPNYTFTFKKDDMFVEFITTDKYIVERQFPIWVNDASIYAQKKVSKPEQVAEIKLEAPKVAPPKTEAPIVEAQPVKTPIAMEPKPMPAEVTGNKEQETGGEDTLVEKTIVEEPKNIDIAEVEPQIETPNEEVAEPTAEIVTESKDEVFDKASTLLKTINSIQNPEEEPVAEPVAFEQVLEKSIENPTFEPNPARDQRFLDIVNSKNTTDKFHYLIITAYYLSEIENLNSFSLKQLNAKLMQNLSTLIDHTILQDALTQQFMDIVPDLTGMSDVCEYRLTDKGEEFFNQI